MNTPAPLAVADIPLGAYLHFPWCVQKCPYCDFNSHALRGELPERDYVQAVCHDIAWELAQRPETRPVQSLFIGGGTPSLIGGDAMATVLDTLRTSLNFADDIEITLEANPGTVDAAHFEAYRRAGVNRLSIGVQSLNDERLRALGRIHDAATAREAVRTARSAGFDNINLDLMFALPEQDLGAASDDLAAALALEPEHLSYYHLTLEPNTAFYRAPPRLPDADLAADMLSAGVEALQAAGYGRYEVSAYARDGRRCRHNLGYWQFGDYLAFGAGAHAKQSTLAQVHRRARQRQPARYQQASGSGAVVQEEHTLDAADRTFEFLMNALRCVEGFAPPTYAQRTGLSADALFEALQPLVDRGLLLASPEVIRCTPRGFDYLDTVLGELLPEPAITAC